MRCFDFCRTVESSETPHLYFHLNGERNSFSVYGELYLVSAHWFEWLIACADLPTQCNITTWSSRTNNRYSRGYLEWLISSWPLFDALHTHYPGWFDWIIIGCQLGDCSTNFYVLTEQKCGCYTLIDIVLWLIWIWKTIWRHLFLIFRTTRLALWEQPFGVKKMNNLR